MASATSRGRSSEPLTWIKPVERMLTLSSLTKSLPCGAPKMIARQSNSIWLKIVGSGFAAVLFTSVAIGGLSFQRQYQSGEDSIETHLASDIDAIQTDMHAQARNAEGVALVISGEPDMADLMVAKAREEIVRRFITNFNKLKSSLNLQLLTFSDTTGVVLARVHDPEVAVGDNISDRRKMYAVAVKTGAIVTGIEPGRAAMAVFASAPVFKAGKVVGVADVGTTLTTDYFARLKSQLKADIAVRLIKGDGFETQNSTYADKPILADTELKAVTNGDAIHRSITRGDRSFEVGGVPVKDYSGRTIGVIEVASDV
ncbi:cache domain-containing protein, partial [Acidisphaera sp. L21]|uniref:cache domain-containing protein n=1 Tax=Acidisphaera sp. L21 TaxID=1641851 RepID=UPI001C2061ED